MGTGNARHNSQQLWSERKAFHVIDRVNLLVVLEWRSVGMYMFLNSNVRYNTVDGFGMRLS